MAKVTSKLQVTIPKVIADRYGIEPGAEIDFRPAGDVIRIVVEREPASRTSATRDRRLRQFDAATARQRARERGRTPASSAADRGWTREELYDRGRSR